MKVIKDLVHNHFGSQHWILKDMPSKDWVHNWPEFTKSSFKDQVLFDPYASEVDRKIMTDGWFDGHMPDLNQKNEFVKNYLTQSHIWWIEYAGLDGFRLDTYAYNDPEFMAEWAKLIKAEYIPETWVYLVIFGVCVSMIRGFRLIVFKYRIQPESGYAQVFQIIQVVDDSLYISTMPVVHRITV